MPILEVLKNMYCQHNLIHRNVTIWNIMLLRSEEKPRGVLLDYSCAAKLTDGCVEPMSRHSPVSAIQDKLSHSIH
jgi:hypothetical protein